MGAGGCFPLLAHSLSPTGCRMGMATRMMKPWMGLKVHQDELMAASIGDLTWLRLSLNKNKGNLATDQAGHTALHMAALHSRLDSLRVLVEEFNMDVNQASVEGWRPIHMVISKGHQIRGLQCLKYLLSHGAQTDVQTTSGMTALHMAANEGLLHYLMTLIEAGANVNIEDNSDHKPIDKAKIWGRRRCAKYLASVMWESNANDIVKEMNKLEKMKPLMLVEEKYMNDMEEEEKEYFNNEAFKWWLEKKHMRNILDKPTAFYKKRSNAPTEWLKQRRDSLILNQSSDQLKAAQEFGIKKSRGSCRKATPPRDWIRELRRRAHPKELDDQTTMAVVGTARKPRWNPSTNPSTHPVTKINRPVMLRTTVDPKRVLKDYNFEPFFRLGVSKMGRPELRTYIGWQVGRMPSLPDHVIRKNLFPFTVFSRLHYPENFRSPNILTVLRKRRPPSDRLPVSEIGLHLREVLEPEAFTAYTQTPTDKPPTPKPPTTKPPKHDLSACLVPQPPTHTQPAVSTYCSQP
uniref:Ankyrin repeat domain-containing protein 53 n=1 Tax=Callorhinchus milii TaxID=7868 RepID=V9KS06_CALMI